MRASLHTLLFASLFACGGAPQSAPPPSLPPDPVTPSAMNGVPTPMSTPTAQPEPVEVAPAPPPPPPPPKVTSVQIDMAPMAGTKMKPVTLTIEQTEGQPAKIAEVSIEGLRPGKYQLVVHDASACGVVTPKVDPSAAPIAKAPGEAVIVEVGKDGPGIVPATDVAVVLEGTGSIIGKTLVLHEERAGKLGAGQACGAIVSKVDMPADPSGGEG